MYVSVRGRPGADPAVEPGSGLPRVGATVVLLGIVSLLTDVSSEMVAAVLPVYLTAELGLGLLAYGVVDGLYQGASALVRIFGGYLGDRSNRPKWVAAAGYSLSAASRLAMLPAHGFAAVTAVVTADRLGKGLRTAPRDALIADASDPRTLGRSFGAHRTLDTIGAAAGPLVAFSLLWFVPGGYSAVFVASFAFAVLGVAVMVLFVPDRRSRATGGLPVRRVLRELAGPGLRRPLVAAGVLGLFTIGDGFVYLSLQDRDQFAASYFPLLFVGTNVAYLTFAIPLGRLADRVGRSRVFVGGHLALLVAYLVAAAPVGGLGATVVALVLLGTFYAATDGVLAALVSRRVASDARGSGIAAAQTVVVIARFAGALAFGSLWQILGRQAALCLLAGLLLAGVVMAGRLLSGRDRPGSVGTTATGADTPGVAEVPGVGAAAGEAGENQR
ncbi:MFS transporter [Micromonospora inositola]|uniref:Major Facilitator Superfamily protein n=1 Tax=Micromonospora inositola TaxID=47865 RepID=A0A1C5JFE6_9ACTN|nr:MFS transporter [Micromonospora inositola]SCG68736.1 Major Facilitator Superfamily protein [Micromonospora inositola]